VFDFAKAMIDHEIARMLKQLKKGIRFDSEALCLGMIRSVGPGGTFMDQDHTLRNMRTAAYLPRIATREMGERWEEEGRVDIAARGLKEALSILAGDNPAVFGEEIDRKILARFPGLLGPSGKG
jgi:trimethylamine--corrinoid protein Co-methyltransferase